MFKTFVSLLSGHASYINIYNVQSNTTLYLSIIIKNISHHISLSFILCLFGSWGGILNFYHCII